MIVCSYHTVLYHFIRQFLGSRSPVPLSVIFMHRMDLIVLIQWKDRISLHLLCAENAMNVMYFFSSPGNLIIIKDCGRLKPRQDNEVITVKFRSVIRILIMFGKAQKVVSMLFKKLYRLFR